MENKLDVAALAAEALSELDAIEKDLYRYGLNYEAVPPTTCLDRARIALEGTGQVFCAHEMRKIQDAIRMIANLLGEDGTRAGSNILVAAFVELEKK